MTAPSGINQGKKEKIKISLLTGGRDPHYALGLLSGLAAQNMDIDFIGNNEMQHDPAVKKKNVAYFNLRGDQDPHAHLKEKILRVIQYYASLIKYASATDSELFHVLWLNKFEYFDRIILNLYYKWKGKLLVFTAHNVNAGERDGRNTFLNRVSLKVMYGLTDHIIVHTEKMKQQLIDEFKLDDKKVSVVPFGINNAVPRSGLTPAAAKKKLSLENHEKVILFFGNIAPYKGLEHLVRAAALLKEKMKDFKIVIAGGIKKDCESYWTEVQRIITEAGLDNFVIKKIRYIPDEEIELYCQSADVLILPYNHIFQSGVIFLAYSFGLPVIASDVGSLREEIITGETGYICRPGDPKDICETIERYFQSDLFENLEKHRRRIINYAQQKYSWDAIGEKTCAIYRSLL